MKFKQYRVKMPSEYPADALIGKVKDFQLDIQNNPNLIVEIQDGTMGYGIRVQSPHFHGSQGKGYWSCGRDSIKMFFSEDISHFDEDLFEL